MQRNGSDDVSGHFNMHTGADDITQLGNVKEWNYKPTTDFYEGECNDVRGSGGEYNPPGAKKDKPIAIFNGELCRPLDLYFTEEMSVEDINLYKYSATERSVDNGTQYPEAKCFSHGESVPSGVMNVTACRYGAPIFISFPHFYAADPYYLNFVEGQTPSKKDHEFYIALEPLTGIPVEVAARLQANILIRASPNIALFQTAPYMFFPLIWFEQKVQIPSEILDDIKIALSVSTIGYICSGIITGFGLILLIWLGFQRKSDGNDDEKMKNGVEFKKSTINMPEFSPLMKPEKPAQICITKFSDKCPDDEKSTPVNMAPLATDEVDSESSNVVDKESIMLPQ